MNQEKLNELMRQLGISADQILREEAEMEFLEELAKDKLSANVVFYGGTALRLAYDSPRFSEDIDMLDFKKSLGFKEFSRFIENFIKSRTLWKLKNIKDKRNTYFALLLVRDEKLKHDFSLKIEIHKPKNKVKMSTELRLIKSSTSVFEPLLLTPTLSDLATLKEKALMSRKKARDIFDLWYICQALRTEFVLPKKLPVFAKREFLNELQVFLPKKYYPIATQLYDQISRKN